MVERQWDSKKRTSGIAVASLVCGICALVLPWISFLLSVLAIIFGGIGIGQTGKNSELGGRGLAIGGLVCGIVSLVAWIPLLIFWSALWFWAL